ncbi:MAG: carboxypeptidase-like regulatory domain-containing protein [Bryobacteraceae bacterium]|nr:carboxypeptidase-like regulatory domain-containing protein [Bryobacteraceae bacterium]
MYDRIRCKIVFLILAALTAASLWAQVSGRMSGTVIDPSGNVIVGAEVTVTNEGTGETATTKSGELGQFLFPNVLPGTYTLRVKMNGFTTHERTNLVVNANQSLTLGDISLTVGSVTETVSVVAQGATVQTDTTGQTALLSSNQLSGLMQRGRDIVALMTVLPGVSQNAGSDSLGGNWGTETPNMQGTRSHWNVFALDGQPGADIDALSFFTISVSMDAIEEVSVKSSSFLAENGRTPGVQVNILSKSGTKEFHGSAYYFKRHEMFNANNFFNNRLGIGKPLVRYNTFGGVLGGPIFIPKVFNTSKDKLFFFVSREDWRIKLPGPLLNTTLPTELERAGNFSRSFDQNGQLITVQDPLNGRTPFVNNTIPANRINVFGQRMLAWHPNPNFFDTNISRNAFNYRFQETREQPKYQTQIKVDYLPTARDRISFRPRFWTSDLQGQAQSTAFGGNFFAQPHRYKYKADAYAGAYTRTFSPTVINEFNIAFSKVQELGTMDEDRFQLANVRREKHNLQGLRQLFPSVNPLNLIPQMSFGGLPNAPSTSFDPRTPIEAEDTRWFITNNLSWVKGRHNMKFGFYFEQNVASEGPRAAGGGHMGNFNFGRDANNPLDSNHPFANAILGNFFSYQESNNRTNGQASVYSAEWFLQDSWKATKRLNIDFGVRFYSFTPWRYRRDIGAALSIDRYDTRRTPLLYRPALDANGRRVAADPRTGQLFPTPYIGAFVPGTGDRFNGVVLVTDDSYPEGFRDRPPLQVAPRAGFALDAFGNGKTVVRGGFGVAKQTVFSSQNSMWTTTTAPPFIESPTIFFGTIDTFLGAGQVLFPTDASSFDRPFENVPTVYNWLFGIQQSVGLGSVLDVSYAGNSGRWLRQNRPINTLPPGTRFRADAQDPTTGRPLPDIFLRPYLGFQGVSYIEDSGYSNYHALQVALNRRYAKGFQYGVAYTWSKAMGIANQDGGGLPIYRDYRTYLYGKLGFDQTHMFVFNYLYSLPKLQAVGGHWLGRAVFHNWEIAGITTLASGFPQGIGFSFIDGVDRWGGGDAPRVNMVGNPVLSKGDRTFFRYFNTDAIAAPLNRGDFGNAPRDVYRGPGINNWDLTVYKNFPITERARFQFRWEFYNLFNHTQFNAVDNNARFDAQGRQVNGQFGQLTGARLERQMQLSLRVEF